MIWSVKIIKSHIFFLLHIKNHNILPSLSVSLLSNFLNKKHLFVSIMQLLTQEQLPKAQVSYTIDCNFI